MAALCLPEVIRASTRVPLYLAALAHSGPTRQLYTECFPSLPSVRTSALPPARSHDRPLKKGPVNLSHHCTGRCRTFSPLNLQNQISSSSFSNKHSGCCLAQSLILIFTQNQRREAWQMLPLHTHSRADPASSLGPAESLEEPSAEITWSPSILCLSFFCILSFLALLVPNLFLNQQGRNTDCDQLLDGDATGSTCMPHQTRLTGHCAQSSGKTHSPSHQLAGNEYM